MSKILEKIEDFLVSKVEIWLKQNWQRPLGFLALVFFFSIFFLYTLNKLLPAKEVLSLQQYIGYSIFVYYLHLFLLIYLVTFLGCFQFIKYPKTPKKKIGIYIAILNRYKDHEAKKFLKNIHEEIQATLNNVGFGDIFCVYSLDEFKSKRIIDKKLGFLDPLLKKSIWSVNMDNTRWNFVLYGSIKKAKSENEYVYKIEPDYAIRHAVIDQNISKDLSKDLTIFLKGQPWKFPLKQEMNSLELVAENMRENILFALGAGAYVSGFIKVANLYHEKLLDLITPRLEENTYLKSLLHKTQEVVVIENHTLGNYFFFGKKDIDSAINYQEKVLRIKNNHYGAHLNLAHHFYLKNPDQFKDKIDYHLSMAEKYQQDSAFKLSQAFLKIQRGSNLKEGIELYDSTLRNGLIPVNTINPTLTFLKETREVKSYPYLEFLVAIVIYRKINETEGRELLRQFLDKFDNNIELKVFTQKAKKFLGIS